MRKRKELLNENGETPLETSFEEYDRKYGIKLRYPKKEEYPGFPVSEVSGFRWIREDEVKLISDYANRKKRKPLRANLNVALFNIKKKMHI